MPRPRIVTALLDLVIPSTCAGCAMPGPALCDACCRALAPLSATGCQRCGHPWPVAVPRCAECPLGVAWSRQAMAYDVRAARVITALKDAHRRAVAEPLAQLMCDRIASPAAGAVLVPVPSSRARVAERGFNQAALLAGALARGWGVAVAEVLVRDDHGAAQRGASRAARLGQVQGAFRAVRRVPHHVVLVDDVLTTGATITAAARTLRAAGCAQVGAVVTARVVLGRGLTRVG